MATLRIAACLLVTAILALAAPTRAADLDVSTAVAARVPHAAADSLVTFKTADGKEAWARRLSAEEIPTPAYGDGRLFSGGGFSSKYMWAIEALTGKCLWCQQVPDNGPSSPVVVGSLVSYDTESCHNEVRDVESGSLVWKESIAPSLLVAPAAAGNALVIPHPNNGGKGAHSDEVWKIVGKDLKTGKTAWDAPMTADVLSAPIVAGDKVFFTCTDGRVFCLRIQSGGNEWIAKIDASSAPVIVGNTVAVSVRQTTGNTTTEGIVRIDAEEGDVKDEQPLAATPVGADAAPRKQGTWNYQGAKLAAAHGRLFNAPANVINAVDAKTGAVAWRTTVKGLGPQTGMLTPPALGAKYLYTASAKGHLLVLNQDTGALVKAYDLGVPVVSQPILAKGNVYLATADGLLVCLKLNDPDAEGWYAWGGNAGHNKVD